MSEIATTAGYTGIKHVLLQHKLSPPKATQHKSLIRTRDNEGERVGPKLCTPLRVCRASLLGDREFLFGGLPAAHETSEFRRRPLVLLPKIFADWCLEDRSCCGLGFSTDTYSWKRKERLCQEKHAFFIYLLLLHIVFLQGSQLM